MVYNFEIEGQKYTLYFGMVATQIIAEKSAKHAVDGELDNFKAFAYIIYGGLCNQADRVDDNRPLFDVAYDLAELISQQDEAVQIGIFEAWKNTKPAQAMLDLLPKQADSKKKVKPKTGAK